MDQEKPSLRRSVCPFDCPDACSLLVEVSADRRTATSVSGDPDHPYTRGHLCLKMRHYEKSVHSAKRLREPLIRRRPKSDGPLDPLARGSGSGYEPISWAEAIAMIIERWRLILDSAGAESILPYSYAGTMGIVQRNAGHPFFHRLGTSQLLRTICAPAKEQAWQDVYGTASGGDPDEVRHSDYILLWGIHAAASNLHFLDSVKEAKAAGAKVVLIDVWRHSTASFADEVLLVDPGSDGALALGVMRALFESNSFDHDYLARRAVGFEEWSQQVLERWSIAESARLTGIDEGIIRRIAAEYRAAKAPYIRTGAGLSRYGNGAMNLRLIHLLPALIGAWQRRGGGLFSMATSRDSVDYRRIEYSELLGDRTPRQINMNQLGRALTELRDPSIQSLYIYSSNPALVAPDQRRVLEGLARGDLFTIVHERFATDTAALADLILPATSSLEHLDLYRSYGQNYLQLALPLIEPVGESKSNWQTFRLLAAAFGFGDEEPFCWSEEEWLRHILQSPSTLRCDASGCSLGYDDLADGVARRLSIPAEVQPEKIYFRRDGIREPLPRYRPAYHLLDEIGATDLLLDQFEEYDLLLVTAPHISTLNSTFLEREELVERLGEQSLRIHPSELDRRDLKDGQMALLANSAAEVAFRLRACDSVPPGRVIVEGIHPLDASPSRLGVNALVRDRLTDSGAGSTFNDGKVALRPLESS